MGLKGGPELLRAFREARRLQPDLRLRIVGCTPTVRETGVEVIGPLRKDAPGAADQLSALYRSADLFCMPSRFDAFGIVFVEAMLHGVALRDCLLRALRDRTTLFALGRRARERALALFTWDRVAECMVRDLARLGIGQSASAPSRA